MDRVLGFEHGLPPIHAGVAALAGLVILFFGWKLLRLTLALTGFAIGAVAGQLIARWAKIDEGWGFFVGGAALALLSEPLYRIMVFVLGGLALGLLAGEALGRGLGPAFFLWGLASGFVLGGLLSIWKQRAIVILASSGLGAFLLCWGTAVAAKGLGFPAIGTFPRRHPWLSLLVLAMWAVIGLVVQWRFSPRRHGRGEEERAGKEERA